MKTASRLVLCSGCMTLLLLLVACAVRTPDVSYYSLTPMDVFDKSVQSMVKSDLVLGVGPVTIPEYLKRVQIATRVEHNQYKFNEFMRWSGLLEENIVTVLGNNLGLLLGTDRVATYPWLDYFEPDYRVVVKIQQLDAELGGDAVLVARWAISDSSGNTMLASGKSDLRQPLVKSTYSALVDAESRLLADLCKQLAAQIRQLHAQK